MYVPSQSNRSSLNLNLDVLDCFVSWATWARSDSSPLWTPAATSEDIEVSSRAEILHYVPESL